MGLLLATRRIREFRPHAGHTKKVRSKARRRSIRCQASTLCGQAHARQRVFLGVARLEHSAPPLGRERLPLSVLGGPIDGAGDNVQLGANGLLSECYLPIFEHVHDITDSVTPTAGGSAALQESSGPDRDCYSLAIGARWSAIKGSAQSPRDVNSRPAPLKGDRCPSVPGRHVMPVSPRPVSSSLDQFREFADEAADWARTAQSDKERAIFLQMARTWLEAALALERPPVANPGERSGKVQRAESRTDDHHVAAGSMT